MFAALKKIFRPDPKPTIEWAWSADDAGKYTPDVAFIEERSHHLVFLYGNTKTNHPHSSNKIGWTNPAGGPHGRLFLSFTWDKFELWKKNLKEESFPIALPRGAERKNIFDKQGRRTVKGELWMVSSRDILSLDKFHMNGVLFERQRVRIIVPYREMLVWKRDDVLKHFLGKDVGDVKLLSNPIVHLVKAWMYVGIMDHWDRQLDGGHLFSLVRHFTENKPLVGDYYNFTHLEYNDDDN